MCPKCLDSFERIPQTVCETCGCPLSALQLKEGQPRVCPAGQNKTYGFDCPRSFAIYQRPLVRAILLLKFDQIEPLGRWFAERLAEAMSKEGGRFAADVVVPVPLNRQRERERGYNRAALISKPLGAQKPAPTSAFSLSKNAGSRYVALLPPIRAAKWTIFASC